MKAKKYQLKALAAGLMLIVFLAALMRCTGATTTTSSTTTTSTTTGTGPGGGTISRSDSIVTAQIQSFGNVVNGLASVDILVISSENVSDEVNVTADKVNTVITVKTDEDLSSFKVGDKITAHVQLAGDVPLGTYLYMHDIKKAY